jgi:hypothetical protein
MFIDKAWQEILGMSVLPQFQREEWKAIIDDAKEKILKKSGEQITGTPR